MSRKLRKIAALLFLSGGLIGCGPTLSNVTVRVVLPPEGECKAPIVVNVGNRTYEITTDAQAPVGGLP